MKRIEVPWSSTSTVAPGLGSGSNTSFVSTNFFGSCQSLEDSRPPGFNRDTGPQALDTFPVHSARTPTGKANATSVTIMIPLDAAAVDVLPRLVVKEGFNSGDDHVSLWLSISAALLKDTGLSGKGIGAVHSAPFAVLTLPNDPCAYASNRRTPCYLQTSTMGAVSSKDTEASSRRTRPFQ